MKIVLLNYLTRTSGGDGKMKKMAPGRSLAGVSRRGDLFAYDMCIISSHRIFARF